MNPLEARLARLSPERRAEAQRLVKAIQDLQLQEAQLLAQADPDGFAQPAAGTKALMRNATRAALKSRRVTLQDALKTLEGDGRGDAE